MNAVKQSKVLDEVDPFPPSARTVDGRRAIARAKYLRIHQALSELARAVDELDATRAADVAAEADAKSATRVYLWLQRFSDLLSIPY